MIRCDCVDAGPVRAHLKRHTRRGSSLRHVARLAGVAHSTVSGLARGSRTLAARRTADRVLAVPVPPPVAGPTQVGCVRRMAALAAVGHPMTDIAAAGGGKVTALQKARRLGSFSPDMVRVVARAYELLEDRPGWDTRVANVARRRGCVPSRAWAGVDIDDPEAVPLVFGPAGRPRDARPFTSPDYYRAMTGTYPTRWDVAA